MNNNTSKSNAHEGHRQRLKKRFLENGLSSFELHNIVELLLFYSIPRRDTNEIAHELVSKFGSFKEICDADFNDLITVNGINENSATLLKLIPQISKFYLTSEYKKNIVLDTADKIGTYLINQYVGETKEVIYLLLLDNSFGLIKNIRLHEGSINSAQISLRKIFDEVTKYNAAGVVLAHNHPNGLLIPSSEDIFSTSTLFSSLKVMEITLLEHFLVVGNRYMPLIHETPSLRDLKDDSMLYYNDRKVAQSITYSEKELDILAGRINLENDND